MAKIASRLKVKLTSRLRQEGKAIEALTAMSADLKAVLLAELQKIA